MWRVLGRDFFDRSAVAVARDLLGALLISKPEGEGGERDENERDPSAAGPCVGRIVEVEAYPGPEDPASHAWAWLGRTKRNDPMFGPPGTAYIHQNYGVHWCLNAVTGSEGFPAAVLIRAVEPIEGLELMRRRRRRRPDAELTRGPGRLTQAFAIGPELQRHPLDRAPLYIAEGERVPDRAVARGARIGISRARDLPLRFLLRDSPWVSA